MAEIIIPPDKRTGCLPRRRTPDDVCKLYRTKFDLIPVSKWPELIPKQDGLRHFEHVIFDQNGVGSCAAESATGALSTVRVAEGQPFVELNPWGLYAYTSGGVDRGSSLYDNLVTLQQIGVPPVSLWPRSNGWHTKPTGEAKEAAMGYRMGEFWELTSASEVGTALLRGFAVVFGWSGHSCWLTRLLDTSTAEYRNSWHVSWGDQGHGKIALRSINFGYQAFAYRTSAVRTGEEEAPAP